MAESRCICTVAVIWSLGKVVPVILDVAKYDSQRYHGGSHPVSAAVHFLKKKTERHYGCTVVLAFENESVGSCVDSYIPGYIYRCMQASSVLILAF
jgi:hypothetical protein